MPVTTILLISNLHCLSCSKSISEILWSLLPTPYNVSTSVVSQIVTVTHATELLPKDIVWALLKADFEVGTVDLKEGPQAEDSKLTEGRNDILPFPGSIGWLEEARKLAKGFANAKASSSDIGHRHLENCELCRKETFEKPRHQSWASWGPIGDPPYLDGRISLKPVPDQTDTKVLPRLSRGVEKSDPPQDDSTKDLKHRPNTYEAHISIGGMSCSVCTGKVAETLEAIPWVNEVSINLMVNSGRVIFKSFYDGEAETTELINEIESLGYEAVLDRLLNLAQAPTIANYFSNERKVSLMITDMFCQMCPENIVLALETAFPDGFRVESTPTMRSPILCISYMPRPPIITIRNIFDVITSVDPAYRVSVFHPPTTEQRSLQIQLKERNNYLKRLILCCMCTIPTFLIGVLWMTLVPTTDVVRVYLKEPIWLGNVSRIEWALLIISTPVMFYAANPFHTRAVREIMALWRRRSPVPFFQRFYRFGSMNLLISLGVSISYLSSIAMLAMAAAEKPHYMSKGHTTTYFDSTVFLTTFLLIGRFLEAYSKARTTDGMSFLAELRPKEAVLVIPLQDGVSQIDIEASVKASPAQHESNICTDYTDNRPVSSRRVHVDLLEVGDIVSVAQGASPPADAVVISGTSNFDESSLTGESRMISKCVGDIVYAGTINHGSVINARVEKTTGESMIDDIVNVVREGQNRRAPMERIADRITAYFVPVICFLAISTWLSWLTLGVTGSLPQDYLDIDKGGWYLWSLSFAIAVFVVACPCGIGLAAPCALHVGTGLASRHGILAKGGGEAFQEASSLDCVVFDKTGTLTHGVEPVIADENILFQDESAIQIIYLASRLLEEGSSHPLARALVNYCKHKTAATGICIAMEEIAGKGSKGTIEIGNVIYQAIIGNERFMKEHDVLGTENHASDLHTWKQSGKSIIILAIKSDASTVFGHQFTYAAMFSTADPIREEASFVIHGLRKSGLDVWMITGDNPTTALAVASQVGIPGSHVIAAVLPSEKADKVRELQGLATVRPKSFLCRFFNCFGGREKHRAIVAMVGDGINDAPALSMADVGIAIGSGSDIAMHTSKFILVSSDLTGLLTLTDLSRAVVRRIKFNFLWACIFNVIAIPLAAGLLFPFTSDHIRLEPVWAALAMALSSVSVICCSLLLKSKLWGIGFRPRKMH